MKDVDSDPDVLVFTAAVPASWTAGMKLVLPDTRQPKASWLNSTFGEFTSISNLESYEIETVTIASISMDGKTVTLEEDLQYDHKGQSYQDQDTMVNLNPHAALLTRNIEVTSQNPVWHPRTYAVWRPRGSGHPVRALQGLGKDRRARAAQ